MSACPRGIGVRTRRHVWIGFIVAVVLLALEALVCIPVVRSWLRHGPVYDSLLQDAIDLLAGSLVLARAVLLRRERMAWLLLGAGVIAFAGGDVYWSAVCQRMDPEPDVSFADILWLALYPCFCAGLSWLLRGRLPRLGLATWLDGLIAAAGAAAFASMPFLHAAGSRDGGSVWVYAAGLAYPVADILLVGCMLGAWALTGWRTDRVWLLLLGGMAFFTAGDALAILQFFGGSDIAGAWLDNAWSIGLILIAAAAWQRDTGERQRPVRIWVTGTLPAGLAAACLALLLYGGMRHGLPPTTALLAGAAVGAAVLRMLLTLRSVEALADARRQARTDDLTELPNRRLFLERLETELGDGHRTAPLTVGLLDLDRFKEVNDSFGHNVGDRLLQLVAARLLGAVGTAGMLARIGGDEFGLLLPGAGVAQAQDTAMATLACMREPFELDGTALHVDASIGLAVCPQDGSDQMTLLRHADTAMYTAKDAHSGFSLSARDVDDHTTRRRLDTLEELRLGLEHGDLVLHYQPQIHLATRQVLGVEALVRWDHPSRGLVYPDGFLPIAEHAGLMEQVMTYVLELALRQCASWHRQGLRIAVAVNLSSSNLCDLNFPARVVDALRRHHVSPRWLHLEVTENVLMQDPVRAGNLLAGLRQQGIRLAVDDYGTGYSSLAYLHALPVDDLKLDRAFVAHCDTDPRSAAIVETTIDLGHRLGARIIAEGVESEAVLNRLTAYGCDLAQGYHLGRPQNPKALTPWLHQQLAGSAAGRQQPVRQAG